MSCVAKETSTAVRIRSYDRNAQENVPATIWQAALATSAATSYFEPVAIGPRHYVDGALRNNNPVSEVEAEANNIWCPAHVNLDFKSLVKCFLSIGTGAPAKEAISDNYIGVAKNLKKIVTDTAATHNSFQDRWLRQVSENIVFRFEVAQGLQTVALDDYKKLGAIEAATDEYMDEVDQQTKLQACSVNFMEKECTYYKMILPILVLVA